MCEVTAEPAPSVDWFKEGNPVSSNNKSILHQSKKCEEYNQSYVNILSQVVTGDRYVIHANGLMIKGVEESDDGTYTCRAVVIQTGELAERNIKLEVRETQTIINVNYVVIGMN